MTFGVTDVGFVRKTRDDLVDSMTANSKLLLGNDIDLGTYSEDSLRLQLAADELNELWQLAESVYYSAYAHTAVGASLDRVVSQRIKRSKAKRAIVPLVFSGIDTSEIPVGTICGTSQGIQFITIAAGVIVAGTATVSAQALQSGSDGNVPAGTITTISTARPGINAVTNIDPATSGREIETDLELKQRYFEGGNDGGSSAVRLQSLLENLPSVNLAIVYENAKEFTDAEGRPAHSMEPVIDGGLAAEIADVFMKNWPGGIESYGLQSVVAVDNKGIQRTWYYNVPEDVIIYVDIVITKDPNTWLSTGEQNVKTNCIKVVGGIDTIAGIQTIFSGNGIGANVLEWQLVAAQAGLIDYSTVKVPGIKNMDINIGIVSPPVGKEVVITGRQRAKLLTANITVSYL